MQISDTPFSIIAFAPFLPAETITKQGTRPPLSIQSADQGLAALRPSLYIPLPPSLSPQGGITLEFASLSDFEPEVIVSRTSWMRAIRDGKKAGDRHGMPAGGESPLDSLLSMVELPGKAVAAVEHSGEETNEADAILSGVLTRIFSDDDFRQMKAAWEGVALLFEEAGADRLRLDIVPTVRETAAETLESTGNLLDEAPPDLILMDAPFDSTPVGMKLLETASHLAERLMSPAICWCGPDFLHLDAWSGLEKLPYLPNHLDSFPFARWKALRTHSSAFWTIAACNRFSLKQPCRADSKSGMFRQSRPGFLAPVWGVAALILQSFSSAGTPLVASSRVLHFRDASPAPEHPLEAEVTLDRAHQMTACGMIPMMPAAHSSGIRLAEPVTINGVPIVSPLALSTLIHSLIELRETTGPAEDPEELAESLRTAFRLHPRFKGALADDAVGFEIADSDPYGRITLGVTLKNRMSGAKNIEFTFNW